MDGIYFYEHEFYELSNFSSHSIVWRGNLYSTCEHAYQSAKFSNDTIKDKVIKAKSAFLCKKVAYEYQDFFNPDWENIRVEIMEEILRTKLEQHEDVKDALIRSENRLIFEDSPVDYFWGCGKDKTGKNVVGKLWMKIRDDLILNK